VLPAISGHTAAPADFMFSAAFVYSLCRPAAGVYHGTSRLCRCCAWLNHSVSKLVPSLLSQASCWGVSWYQPFVQLPRLSASAGHEALSPQGAFTVAVQPPLPLIKVRHMLLQSVLIVGGDVGPNACAGSARPRCLYRCCAAAATFDQGAPNAG
jgi:hypothetical protein